MRAFTRRTSATSASVMPRAGKRSGSMSSVNRGAHPRHRPRRPPAAGPGTPRPSTTWRSTRRRSRGSAPAGPACPRAGGRRRPRAAGRPGQGEQPAQLVGDGLGVRRRGVRIGTRAGLVHEHHVGVAAVGQLEAAVAAHRHHRDRGRRLVETLLLADRAADRLQRRPPGWRRSAARGRLRHRPRRSRRTGRRRPGAAARDDVRRGSAAPPPRGRPGGPRRGASLEHRLGRAAGRGPRRASGRPAARARGARSRSARSTSTWASRSATSPSSRSVLRYHGVRPRASLSRRKPNSPASGSGPSANQPSIAGISALWMVAVRVTPLVSASRLRSARLRVGVPERRQPGTGRLGRQSHLVARASAPRPSSSGR